MFQIIFVAFLAFGTVHRGDALKDLKEYDLQKLSYGDTRAILDDILEYVKELYDQAVELIKSGINILNDYLLSIRNYVYEIASNALGVLTDAVNNFIEEIRALKDKAAALGIDIKECIGQSEDDIKALANQTYAEVVKCTQKQLEKAQELVGNAIETISSKISKFSELYQKLKDCGLGISSIPCYYEVAKEAGSLILSLPKDITSIVQEAANNIFDLREGITSCATTALIGSTSQITKILKDVTVCVYEHIGQEQTKQISHKFNRLRLKSL